jgi:FixJ family two-component response regulator
MPLQTSERAIAHIVDDDASLCGALKVLFDSVGLGAQTCGSASNFLSAHLPDKPRCIVIDIGCRI